MKWIFGVLVLANVALFMWGRWYHQPLIDLEPKRPRVAVAPDKMRLLAERGVRLMLRSSSTPAPGPAQETAAGSSCYELGAFGSLEKARAAGAKLDAWGLGYTRVAEFETLGPSYRVYLPPFPSRQAAEKERRELTKLGFSDHAVIQQEEGMENAISLGIFSVEQNAVARVRQLARKNVEALIQPIPNVHPVYWLVLSASMADGQLGTVSVSRFAQENWGEADIHLQPVPCGVGHAAP